MMTGQAFLAFRLRHLLIVASGIQLIACSGDDPSGPGGLDLVVARVDVIPPTLTLVEARQHQLFAQVANAHGQIIAGRTITWSSSNRDIAEMIEPRGTVRARREGTVTIFADCEGVRGQATLTVLRATVSFVVVTPGEVELAPGGQVDLAAHPIDNEGHTLEARTAEWSTSDPLVATVTSAGRVTAHSFGSVFINATVDGVVGRAAVYMLRAPTNVTEIDLGTLGGVESVATSVNGQGVVVGYSITQSGQQHAFRWSATGGMEDLGTLGGNSSAALAINDNGEIVGRSQNISSVDRAFRRTTNGPMEELTISSPGGGSVATAINSAGDIVGSYTLTFAARAFLLTVGGTFHDIGLLPGFEKSTANALNAQRTVVGHVETDDYYDYYIISTGFRWSDGSFRELNVESIDARGVNDAGVVVGTTSTSQPYRWMPGEQPVTLATLGLTSTGAANAINQQGQVAGYAFAATSHAVAWLPSGERLLLSTSSSQAMAISNTGWIVGWRTGSGNSPRRATLWKVAGVSQP